MLLDPFSSSPMFHWNSHPSSEKTNFLLRFSCRKFPLMLIFRFSVVFVTPPLYQKIVTSFLLVLLNVFFLVIHKAIKVTKFLILIQTKFSFLEMSFSMKQIFLFLTNLVLQKMIFLVNMCCLCLFLIHRFPRSLILVIILQCFLILLRHLLLLYLFHLLVLLTFLVLTLLKSMLEHDGKLLNGELDEEIYMTIPQGYTQLTGRVVPPNSVCRLHKSLYGLKQASRQWNHKLSAVISSAGFVQAPSDHSLFVKSSATVFLAALVYVDDILIVGNDRAAIDVFKDTLKKLSSFVISVMQSTSLDSRLHELRKVSRSINGSTLSRCFRMQATLWVQTSFCSHGTKLEVI